MIDIREKLVELFAEAARICGKSDCCLCRYFNDQSCVDALLIDHLLANGVTVQEWIPASEPPETNGCYLVAGNLRWDGRPITREAYWNGDGWLSCDGKCYITRLITHWMRSPHPPKQEG